MFGEENMGYDKGMMEKEEENIVVSILCVTYNQKDYIREAFAGFLMQKTNFRIEVVVFDDASTDGTSDIVREYAEQYPDIFVPLIQDKNTFRKPERMELIKWVRRDVMRGTYIAFCEGDDYWTDPDKLQMQVDYMDAHPDCVLTMHNALQVDYRTGEQKKMLSCGNNHDITAREMIVRSGGMWPTASMVMRREYSVMEDFFNKSGIGDWTLQLYAFSKGRVYYFDRCMSVYRYMHDGSWSSDTHGVLEKKIIHCGNMINFLDEYDRYTNFRFHNQIVIRKQVYYRDARLRLSADHYVDVCERIDKETSGKFHKYLERIKMLYRIYSDAGFLSEECKKFIQNYNNIVIMGAGHYADWFSTQLENNSIPYQGFVVSNDQENVTIFKNKPVYKFADLPYKLQNTGVIIAIAWDKWDEIIQSVQKNGVIHYMTPFLIE